MLPELKMCCLSLSAYFSRFLLLYACMWWFQHIRSCNTYFQFCKQGASTIFFFFGVSSKLSHFVLSYFSSCSVLFISVPPSFPFFLQSDLCCLRRLWNHSIINKHSPLHDENNNPSLVRSEESKVLIDTWFKKKEDWQKTTMVQPAVCICGMVQGQQ